MNRIQEKKPRRESLATSHTLLGRVFAGENDAWELFFLRYKNFSIAVARRFGLNEDEAGEVYQELLVRISEKGQHFAYDRQKSGFRAYLKMIIGSAAKDFIDKNERWKGRNAEAASDIESHDQFAESEEREYRKMLIDETRERLRANATPEQFGIWDALRIGRSGKEVAADFSVSRDYAYQIKKRQQAKFDLLLTKVKEEWD